MGLKHAQASVDDEDCAWSIQTCTPEDNELSPEVVTEMKTRPVLPPATGLGSSDPAGNPCRSL